MKLGIEAPAGHRILRSELVIEVRVDGAGAEAGVGMLRTEIVSGDGRRDGGRVGADRAPSAPE